MAFDLVAVGAAVLGFEDFAPVQGENDFAFLLKKLEEGFGAIGNEAGARGAKLFGGAVEPRQIL